MLAQWVQDAVTKIRALPDDELWSLVHWLDPDKIVNVSPEKAMPDSLRYTGGLMGKKFQGLIKSIRANGVKHPVLVHQVWEKPGCYSVEFGGHRVVSCQVLKIPVPAIILVKPWREL